MPPFATGGVQAGSPGGRHAKVSAASAPTAAERVIAAELSGRGGGCDALSMMVSSMARMVQAGRCSENRWTLG